MCLEGGMAMLGQFKSFRVLKRSMVDPNHSRCALTQREDWHKPHRMCITHREARHKPQPMCANTQGGLTHKPEPRCTNTQRADNQEGVPLAGICWGLRLYCKNNRFLRVLDATEEKVRHRPELTGTRSEKSPHGWICKGICLHWQTYLPSHFILSMHWGGGLSQVSWHLPIHSRSPHSVPFTNSLKWSAGVSLLNLNDDFLRAPAQRLLFFSIRKWWGLLFPEDNSSHPEYVHWAALDSLHRIHQLSHKEFLYTCRGGEILSW